ncbi:MAG TPA: class I SAM-dependent methyltransferase [Acidimicrobiales bacterium]|jgi:ubiquinone/menaquinone biosynthesis C-methylase UbiE|nr:class I SAM-dependent methyltransferase [Acidimicrobiales bacterium]
MEKVDYDTRLHAVYAAGREMSSDAHDVWMEAFAAHLPETRPLVWLDLGSGTGRMTPSLTNAFGGPAHGVEPSEKMRAQARARAGHPAVTYSAGSAEHIPLPDASCDAALVFFVWHHVVDRQRAARELHRAVKPGGTLFVQANFSDKMPDVWWFRVVPEWRAIDTGQFRSEEEVARDFTSAGWTFVARDAVTWLRSATLSEDLERLQMRAVSLFEHMSEEAIDAGFAKIQAALGSLDDGPQRETSDFLVFRR